MKAKTNRNHFASKREAAFTPAAVMAVVLAMTLALSACTAGGTDDMSTVSEGEAGTANTTTAPTLSPEDADGIFSIAVIPDTQQEVVVEGAIAGRYFLNRTQWLVDNREALDLRFAIHTGDIVNWGNEEPKQFEIASEAFEALDRAGIPVALCLGNHDTAAVGVGGSAADPANTRTRQRDTASFNRYFSLERYPGCIPFEEDRIDNAYQLFEAGGKKWLVMTLELWPRTEVVDWANRVVDMYPDHNVIVATHSYLTSTGEIYQGADYGVSSPQYLYDHLISRHENIKLVFSGHTGTSALREDAGQSGEKIVSLLGCYHSNDKNPVQIVEIDVPKGTVSSRVFTPLDGSEWEEHQYRVEGMNFVG